ncbi:MAG TPA: DNA helicase RecQ, partial [Gemmataceae bacterium]
FRSLRPLQRQAMQAVLDRRDSLVVLPTGGGKSLCFQAPALLRPDETTVVVSPLIALMNDQVENLRAADVPARCLTSAQTPQERAAVEQELRRGGVRLLFVSPERLTLGSFQNLLRQLRVRTFAIDEAHCISHWGHDFRPEYRQLNRLRELFPDASLHGYTATATERVRRDIVEQLALREPEILVGDFDRPNLVYRVIPRTNVLKQVREVLQRHPNEAGIIYCIRRKDVDDLAAELRAAGVNAMPYHAGLSPEERRATQEAFRSERCDVVVATVAFGMGIDRSDVRFVLHAGMPKSIEHYQQEAGRAGRDGLEAECILLYAPADYFTWRSVISKSAEENGAGPEFVPQALRHLDGMYAYGRGAVCRHRVLVEHFGQSFPHANCQACDLCLGEVETEPDSLVIAQKILSCVARVQQRYGVEHVTGVLHGDQTERIRSLRHDGLTTYGLLREHSKPQIRDWIYQLIAQELLVQTDDEYPQLRLNAASWEVMRGGRDVKLMRTVQRKQSRESRAAEVSWSGVDRDLFEELRKLRRQLAEERKRPPYTIFTDATLREMCRRLPRTRAALRGISGVGDAKLRDFGDAFLERINRFAAARE